MKKIIIPESESDRYPRHIQGLEEIIDGYETLLLDIWGVLHDGSTLYPGVKSCLAALKANRKTVILVSNAARRKDTVASELEKLGIVCSLYDGLVSSGEIVYHALRNNTLPEKINGRCFYYLGPERSRGIVSGLHYIEVFDIASADFIVNTGASGKLDSTSHDAPVLMEAARRHIPMICANPDLVAIRAGVAGISAGALAAYYEEICEACVWWVGKPYSEIYEQAFKLAGQPSRNSVLAIGDAIRTDVAGARSMQVDSLFVCGGIHHQDIDTEDLNKAHEFFKQQSICPNYYSQWLSW